MSKWIKDIRTAISPVTYMNRPQKEKIKSWVFRFLPGISKTHPKYKHWVMSRVFGGLRLEEKLYSHSILSSSRYIWKYPSLQASKQPQNSVSLAVHIHVYYLDTFEHILQSLSNSKLDIDNLYLTCRKSIFTEMMEMVEKYQFKVKAFQLPNIGRDVYPFLYVLPSMVTGSYDLILKLHTKKSMHLSGSNKWLDDILEKLLTEEMAIHTLNLFKSYPEIGILGPEYHVLPIYLYYGENSGKLVQLCNKMELSENEMGTLHFVAGTMFYARPAALKPLLDLNLGIEDFEEEKGQLDGTLAHALERIIGASVVKAGLVIADTGSSLDKIQFTVLTSYPYAK